MPSIVRVAQVACEIKRGILRSLQRQADANGMSLEETLEAFQSTQFQAIKSGRFIASTTNGSRSVSFSVPTIISQLQPDTFFSLTEELCASCEVALAALVTAGNASPTNEQVRAQMLEYDNFWGATVVRDDFTYLRCH